MSRKQYPSEKMFNLYLIFEYYSFTEQNNFRSHELYWIKQFDSISQVRSLLSGHTVYRKKYHWPIFSKILPTDLDKYSSKRKQATNCLQPIYDWFMLQVNYVITISLKSVLFHEKCLPKSDRIMQRSIPECILFQNIVLVSHRVEENFKILHA